VSNSGARQERAANQALLAASREDAAPHPKGQGKMSVVPVLFHLTAAIFVALLFLGSALIAGWTLARFERKGPRTLTGALLASVVALALLRGLPQLIDGVYASGVPAARVVIAFGLALPTFTFFFVASGWFLRAVLGMLTPRP
jgi:hypothetical protein